MERNSINAIIFDDEESSLQEPRTPSHRLPSPTPRNHTLDILEQEIQHLQHKIKALETHSQSLSQLRADNPSLCPQSTSSLELAPGHIAELLMTIEKKIQLVVRQTKKLVDRLADTFDKKLQSKLADKFKEAGVSKMKEQFAASVQSIESNYRGQLEHMAQQYRQVENNMLARVVQAEQKLIAKVKEFENKEKEYVDWIHHLERQLKDKETKITREMEQKSQQEQREREQREREQKERELREREQRDREQRQREQRQRQQREQQMKRQASEKAAERQPDRVQGKQQNKGQSKRMIEVTHMRRESQVVQLKNEQSEGSSVLNGQNFESLNSQSNRLSQANDSKIQRRHKIFDTANRSSSVSPNTKVVSPIAPSNQNPAFSSKTGSSQYSQSSAFSSKVINPLSKSKLPDNTAPQIPALVIEKTTQPLKGAYNQKETSPWKAMDKSIENDRSPGEQTRRNKIIKDVNQDEFYKDVPKANQGWQRFQDYTENDHSDSDSDQQLVFYRNEDRQQGWGDKWQQKGQKESTYSPEAAVFSPFDLS